MPRPEDPECELVLASASDSAGLTDARAAAAETMSLSLSRGAAQASAAGGDDDGTAPFRDIGQRLVGRFTGESIASGSGVHVNTQLVYAFNANGTVLFGPESH